MAAVILHASDAAVPAARSGRWRVLAAILVAVPLLYWPASLSLGILWVDIKRTTYAHGFVVLAISGWLLWRARDQLTPATDRHDPRRSVRLLVSLAGAALLWELAYRAGLQIGIETLLLVILWLAIAIFAGARAARAALVPVAFLGFALTFWDALNPLAHWTTVRAVGFLLHLFGVPAYINGDVVQIPEGNFEIQGGCSGLHFLIVALAIAALLGELRADRWQRRLQWGLLAGVFALLVNWLRVSTIILAGHLTHMQTYLVRESHYFYGWLLFAAAILAIFLIERRVPLDTTSASGTLATACKAGRQGLATSALAVGILVLPLVLNLTIYLRPATSSAHLPAPARGGWTAVAPRPDQWSPQQNLADSEDRSAFVRGQFRVERLVAVYDEQHPGKKLGGYANRPQGEAQVIAEYDYSLAGRPFKVMRLEEHGASSMLWLNFQSGEREFSDSLRAQIWYSFLTLRSLASPASRVVALWAPCGSDCESADMALRSFLADGGMP